MVLPVPGGGDEGGRDCADLDIDPLEAEHGRAIYCDTAQWAPPGDRKMRERGGAEAAEPELTGSDSEPESDTPEGTACGTGEEASLGASGSSGAGRRINSSGGDLKQEQRSIF